MRRPCASPVSLRYASVRFLTLARLSLGASEGCRSRCRNELEAQQNARSGHGSPNRQGPSTRSRNTPYGNTSSYTLG